MARHGSKTTLIQRIGLNSQPADKLRKTSLEQSLEETEQQASAAEEQRNQMLPSTNHQLNRMATSGNDGKLTATRNGPTSNVLATGRESSTGGLVSGRLMMISGVSLLCLTLFVSVLCFFRARSKQLLMQTGDGNGLANRHGSSIDSALDRKQSLNGISNGSAQCALGPISATLLQQQTNLENGTINGLFANNLNHLNGLNITGDHPGSFNNANSFIIAGTGALFAPQTLSSLDSSLDTYTAANLTIYSNQPSTINYTETNQNKL